MRRLWLRNKRKYTILDDEDYEWASKKIWHMDSHGYAVRREWIRGGKGRHRSIKLHRLVINNTTNLKTDHINGNRLDNRKINLRIVTHSVNLHNSKKTWGESGRRGVTIDKRRTHQKYPWKAEICINGKRYHIGTYSSKKEASLAYNKFKLAFDYQ